MNYTLIGGGIFLVIYTLIVSERIHRTISALLGGVIMILLGIVTQEQAFGAIDWNVIFLLVGMMSIAYMLRETGLFQWIAVQAVRLGKGQPMRILIILTVITAVTSALLDNVTIVVLVAPVTLLVASSLSISPIPFLIAEILASNIGGTATLIGDPPNILIGSAAGIDFTTFAANMAPISLIILLAFMGMAPIMFRKDLQRREQGSLEIDVLDTSALITDGTRLRRALIVLVGVVIGFFVHSVLHLESATIAMTGAVVLMLWGKYDPHDVLRDIEWTTLFFFIGLFITIEGIINVGIIAAVGEAALRLTGGSLPLTSMLLVWFSAIASGIVDNIPYTVTMIPLVERLGQTMPITALWWSLALGACLGGNLTLIGAAANVFVANLAEKSGQPIGFTRFLRYSLLVTFVSLVLASFYIWLRYLV
jgi:Na+/H+ antiporter NhaD/arsenite permease-like protein